MKSCATCQCFNRTSYNGDVVPSFLGWCQARAPVLTARPPNGQTATWPIVGPEDYCEHDYVEGEPRKPMMVWRIDMIETERGWGMKPDGHMLFSGPEIAKAYFQGRQSAMPENAPEVYTFPDAERWEHVDKETYDEVRAKGFVRRP